MISFTVPWPPSANTYYRHLSKGPLAGRTLISEEGRAYRRAVIQQARLERLEQVPGRLKVELYAYPPDLRKRDLGNVEKALLDALQQAKVIADDGDIDSLLVERGPVRAGGCVRVKISEIGERAPRTADLFDALADAVPF